MPHKDLWTLCPKCEKQICEICLIGKVCHHCGKQLEHDTVERGWDELEKDIYGDDIN